MALDNLGKAINAALRKLTRGVVDEKLVKEICRDIQRALLQADVNVSLVFELTKRIEERALEEKLPPGISRAEHVTKIVYDEITGILGDKKERIQITTHPTILSMVGIQGSGKTTTCGKLARHFQKKGFKVGIVCADTFRPGAFEQLSQYASVDVFGDPEEKNAITLAREGVDHFTKKKVDLIIVDTAGRHKEETGLIEEMNRISKAIAPNEVILVVDGTIGQQAYQQAEAFMQATDIGSILITKLDGSAKGGGALSAVHATGAPIKFIGEGEKIDALEEFDPKRYVARLLGLGDIESLLSKVKEATEEHELTEKDALKFMTGKFSLKDMYQQLEMVSSMGPLQQIMKMIPGFGVNVPSEMIELSEERLARFRIIMDSMTDKELKNPKTIHFSNIKRIARGSGTNTRDVKELLDQYNMMKKLFKQFGKRGKRLKLPKGFQM
ncbi:MAG: signal recognition particle protein [Theionarchaea archaeon]|nr:MAG: signal recognition particle [Theionarchaea archaeon DG-70]MBU7010992.1 signal recognition particle protein [Theionarchaea archaeon]